jgi:uncharacterized protein YcbX
MAGGSVGGGGAGAVTVRDDSVVTEVWAKAGTASNARTVTAATVDRFMVLLSKTTHRQDRLSASERNKQSLSFANNRSTEVVPTQSFHPKGRRTQHAVTRRCADCQRCNCK